ncbi:MULTISPECIES: hypothetical protein [Bombella]|uniref:Uncharacterized protein n=1 Tax=Bombella pollinis TaxID=2967337 RepID=A0ABT3WMP3_9PROT|nr:MULTISPECIES: hypothetical protein [Bombella]MCX5619425.1 hypothetical protein [Bombella pollinis]MUG04897.1 hypothetical protein [Bombella sp. ESL0378]MUG90438.1 hypothetical protein [Bombella sp. ESL0385]
MPDFDALQRVWLMDWFGHVLNYDADRKDLRRQFLTPCEYPDLFMISSWPVQTPSRVMLRRTSSIPQGLPEAQFVEAGKHIVGLQTQGAAGTFLSINPSNEDTHWYAGYLLDWERFIPLTKPMMDAFSIFIDGSFAELKINGKPVSGLTWPDVAHNIGNYFWLGEHKVALSRNLEKLAEIGEIPPGKSVDVLLLSPESDQIKLTVTRSDVPLED